MPTWSGSSALTRRRGGMLPLCVSMSGCFVLPVVLCTGVCLSYLASGQLQRLAALPDNTLFSHGALVSTFSDTFTPSVSSTFTGLYCHSDQSWSQCDLWHSDSKLVWCSLVVSVLSDYYCQLFDHFNEVCLHDVFVAIKSLDASNR